ncbi:23137_t:CDS:2 [Rhizophagus irregularis]|nr:23137_t:CDS:2 [Rhizophagus irregularis]
MSDKPLSSQPKRVLELLLKPGMKEKLEEDRKKYFNLTVLKKWEESDEPFEEDEEILYINNQKNEACHSTNPQLMGHNTEAKSAGTGRHNLTNGRERNTGNTFEFYLNKDQKTQKQTTKLHKISKHCSEDSGSTKISDNPVLADESVVNQQNSVNIKVIEDKKIDDYPEKPANVSYSIMTQLKRYDFQKELDSEILIASLDSATSLNEKNGQGYSSIANEQVLNNQKITYNQKVEQDLRYELSAYMECKGQTEEVALQSDKAFNIEISEFSLEMILTGSSEVIAQNILPNF